MIKMMKIADGIYTPLDNILDALCKEAGLPTRIEDYYINKDGNLAHTVSAYHNRVEEDVVSTDKDRIKLAEALKTVHDYFNVRATK
jgi:hypothetical protein